jgi:SPP1 gp7 family putative phage head morphogenesis protein
VTKKIDKLITSREVYLQQQLKIALDDTRKQLAGFFDKYAKDGVVSYAEAMKYGRLEALEKNLMAIYQDAGVNYELQRIPKKILNESFQGYSEAIQSKLGKSINWGLIPQKAVDDIILNPLDKIARNTLSTVHKERITRAITQGLLQGQGYDKISKGIKEVYGKTAYQAVRVARTEGQKAQVAGQLAVYEKTQKLGIKVKLFWDAFIDKRTRESHIQMDGVEAQEKDGELLFYFKATGQWVKAPMDSSLPAEHTINCRCRLREELVIE